ncbi:hypothetical protein [Syntrophomonas erecta]
MNPMVTTIYRNAIEKVAVLEQEKRDISREILLARNKKRKHLIYKFLEYDQKKHELLLQVARVALQNQETSIIADLKRLYSHTELQEDLVNCIAMEIKYCSQFMEVLSKGLKYPGFMTFTEKRTEQEVCKYVLEKARQYSHIKNPFGC